MGNDNEQETTRGPGRKKKRKAADMPTTNHLLVIGINKYADGIQELNNAVKDAKAFRKILNEKYGFEEENIVELYDEEAKGSEIIKALDKLEKKLGKNDSLIFYFSGHGELVNNRGYWLPFDSISEDRQSYVINTEIQDFMKNCRAKHILGIVDACYAGALFLRNNKNKSGKYSTKTSRQIMTSGYKEPVPDGLPNFHSPFAEALLSALEDNQQAQRSTNSIWEEMKGGLEYNTEATPLFEPVRDAGHQGGEFYFINPELDEIPSAEFTDKSMEERGSFATTRAPREDMLVDKLEADTIPKDLRGIKKYLKKLVSKDIEKAFELLEDVLDEDSSHVNTLILFQARYNNLKGEKQLGINTKRESDVETNKISYNFMSLIDDLEKDDLK